MIAKYARTFSGIVHGIEAVICEIVVQITDGTGKLLAIGYPELALREMRMRVKYAIEAAGYKWPEEVITVIFRPVGGQPPLPPLTGSTPGFDLPIALAILVASGQIKECKDVYLSCSAIMGELSLDGEVRPVRGVYPAVKAAMHPEDTILTMDCFLAPAANSAEAYALGGNGVTTVRNLGEAVQWLTGDYVSTMIKAAAPHVTEYPFDMSDICGQAIAIRALEVAAAGGHNILLIGPCGSGRTMMARRLLTILPPLEEASLDAVKSAYSVVGLGDMRGIPFRAPHHTISEIGMFGGGAGRARPGEVTLASNGVLFLDELAEFHPTVLERLAQVLTEGRVTVGYKDQVTFPAHPHLVGAMGACPCGVGPDRCKCTPQQRQKFMDRMKRSPLWRTFDMVIEVPAVPYRTLKKAQKNETSAVIRARVEAAWAAFAREVRDDTEATPCSPEAQRWLNMMQGASARDTMDVLKLGRTIAVLEESDTVLPSHLAEALTYRRLA